MYNYNIVPQDSLSTTEAIGAFLAALINLITTFLSNLITDIFNWGVKIVNMVVQYFLEMSAYTDGLVKLLPKYLYIYVSILLSAIVVRMIIGLVKKK